MASSSTSGCAASCPPPWSRCVGCATCSRTSGRELEAKIIELDKNRNNVVLSRRAWLEQTQSEVRTEFLNKLQKGQVRKGVVSSIVNFGAFVDLGGVDGLVHVSELSWKHIDHPSEVVEVGQEVEVEVLDVDLDRERVSLSLKATQEDPWRQFARTHAIQQIVPGKVTKLVPFGAFVRVDDGIEGLVHISELAERHVEIPEQVVQVGSEVMVKVIDIDLERRRISLSLKQANEGFVEGEEHFDPTLYGMAATYDDRGQLHLPGGLRPGDRRVARGLRQAARGVGAAVRRGASALGGPHQAGADGPPGRRRRGRRAAAAGPLAAAAPVTTSTPPRPRAGRPRSRPAPWPPTRRSPPCARSSPAARADGSHNRREAPQPVSARGLLVRGPARLGVRSACGYFTPATSIARSSFFSSETSSRIRAASSNCSSRAAPSICSLRSWMRLASSARAMPSRGVARRRAAPSPAAGRGCTGALPRLICRPPPTIAPPGRRRPAPSVSSASR